MIAIETGHQCGQGSDTGTTDRMRGESLKDQLGAAENNRNLASPGIFFKSLYFMFIIWKVRNGARLVPREQIQQFIEFFTSFFSVSGETPGSRFSTLRSHSTRASSLSCSLGVQ
jgi:hypothetical protein